MVFFLSRLMSSLRLTISSSVILIPTRSNLSLLFAWVSGSLSAGSAANISSCVIASTVSASSMKEEISSSGFSTIFSMRFTSSLMSLSKAFLFSGVSLLAFICFFSSPVAFLYLLAVATSKPRRAIGAGDTNGPARRLSFIAPEIRSRATSISIRSKSLSLTTVSPTRI